jgi:hypothetical protein
MPIAPSVSNATIMSAARAAHRQDLYFAWAFRTNDMSTAFA